MHEHHLGNLLRMLRPGRRTTLPQRGLVPDLLGTRPPQHKSAPPPAQWGMGPMADKEPPMSNTTRMTRVRTFATFAAGVVLGGVVLTGATASAHTHHDGPMSRDVRVWNWGTVKGHPGCYAWTGYYILVKCADGWGEVIAPVLNP